MKTVIKVVSAVCALTAQLAYCGNDVESQGAPENPKSEYKEKPKTPYENYSFDYSAHKVPIAYKSHFNAIELHSHVKLNSRVEGRGGGYTLDKEIIFENFEVDIDFTIESDTSKARGFEAIFTEHFQDEDDFEKGEFGYSTEYLGIGVYVFRHPIENKFYAMLLQNSGTRSVFPNPKQMFSA